MWSGSLKCCVLLCLQQPGHDTISLVKLTARAFYDDVTTKGDSHIKSGRSDNRGIAVIVLDALTRRQWVREEDLEKDLKLNAKQLRRTLRFFEEEKLVTRDHRRETAKGAKVFTAAMAAVSDNQRTKDGEEKIKMHTHSYCCLDYAQIFDVVRYRLHRMKKKLKDELEDKNTVQEYVCTKCPKRYNALDALRLVSMEDEYFHCENCNAELVAQSAKLAAQEGGDGDDNARRRRTEKLKDMLQNMDGQLKPLMEQINRLKDLSPPEFGTFQSWEARVHAAGRPNGDAANDQSRSQAFGLSGTPMPFLGETKVEVAFSGADVKGEDTNSGSGSAPLKVLPPWMIKRGMKLTEEQRGEVRHEVKMEGSSADVKDDKKPTVGESNEEDLKGEYLKAYYAAMSKREEETTEAKKRQEGLLNTQSPTSMAGTSSDRQVGMKFKREDGDNDDGWEEDTPAVNANKSFKVDLNVEAGASEEDDGDGSDWEDGE